MNRRCTTAIVHAVVALLWGCSALAAAPDPAPASPPAEYRIGPGDVLAIAVWGEPELSTPAGSGWEVRPDGKISVPLLGEVAASGYTIAAFSERLTRGLAEYVKDPRVTVNVVSFRRVRVQALGQLQQPGQYALPPDARLLDLLALAGGPTDRAALADATLTRAGTADETVHIDLAALLRGGETEWNLPLVEGDVLFVPERPPVTVLGEVLRPGVYEARSGARLSDVLAAAGGPSERADLSRVRVYGPSEVGGARPRSGSHPSEAQGPLIYEGAAATGPVLSGGEVVVVPETRWVDWTKVFAFLAGLKVLKDLIGL